MNVPVSLSAKWFKELDKKALMKPDEYETYSSLPSVFEVYRGVSKGRNPKGMSWTYDFDKAEWFANRFGEGYVIKGVVNKDDVLAYFSRRSESEILIAAKDVHEQTIIRKDTNAAASVIC